MIKIGWNIYINQGVVYFYGKLVIFLVGICGNIVFVVIVMVIDLGDCCFQVLGSVKGYCFVQVSFILFIFFSQGEMVGKLFIEFSVFLEFKVFGL